MMKRTLLLLVSLFGFAALACLFAASEQSHSQQPPSQPQPQPQQMAPIDPAAPLLTLDEKITLTTDDIKRSDILDKANKQLQESFKPINEHQTATIAAIEKEHPGWVVEQGPNGWHLVRKQEPEKKPAAEKAEPAKK